MRPSESNPAPWSDQDLDALLREFFAHELPREMPPLPAQATRCARVAYRGKRLGASVAAAAAAASIAFVVWLLWEPPHDRTVGPRTSVEEPAAQDIVVAAGAGYRVVQHGRPARTGSSRAEHPAEEPLQFRWNRSAVYEPVSGEQIEIDMPEVTVAVNDLTITMTPYFPVPHVFESDSVNH